MKYIKCVTCGKVVTIKDELCWWTTTAYWAGKGLETPEIRPTPLAPDRAKRAAKSKPSASKRSKSGAAGKA